MAVAQVEDLPAEAARDAESLRLAGTLSTVIVPLRTRGLRYGCLTFAMTRMPRSWPRPLVTQFELVAEVFARALTQQQTGNALREHAARLELAVESAHAGSWDLDLASLRIHVTADAAQLYGLPPAADVTLQHVLELVHPDDRHIVRDRVWWARDHQSSYSDEYRLMRPDGTVRWLLVRGRPFADDPQRPAHRMLGISLDITDRKMAEERLQLALDEATRLRDQLQHKNGHLREITTPAASAQVVGRSPAIRRALAQVEQVAPTPSTVLLLGETGTGKGRFAAAIHALSPRRARPMVHVNCSAIPHTLIESELFGREKGAYTGALTKQIGRFEMAHGSTIFLDEVSELPLDVQAKLLRVLEEKRIERLGSPSSVAVDIRIIAASNQDLDAAQRAGTFRSDLFYRLNVFPITVPPLRERPEDIPLLVKAIVEELSATMAKRVDAIPRVQMNALVSYPWPGNVRELRNAVERAMIMATGPTLTLSVPAGAHPSGGAGQTLHDVERAHVLAVLQQAGWRIRGPRGAATILALPPTTLENRMRKLRITRPGSNNAQS